MDRRQLRLASLAGLAVLSLAGPGAASACERDPGRPPIQVSVENGQPVASPETVKACEGETIKWVFKGSEAKQFAIRFTSAADSPFDWSEQTGAKVEGTVKSGAARNRQRTEYPYDVSVEDQTADPRIVVEP